MAQQSITLQTSDADIIAGDIIGRVSFAASNESSGSEAKWIAASIYAQATGEFTSTVNPTNLVFATSDSDGVTPRYKITNVGHFLPELNTTYELGSNSFKFNNIFAATGTLDRVATTGIQLTGSASQSGLLYINNNNLISSSPNVLFSNADLASPKLIFKASGSLTPDISLNMLTTATNVASGVQTLSIQGSAGELFSITDVLDSGTIFSVNDISGLGLIEADADGTVTLVRYGTNVAVGNVTPTEKLHVAGNLRVEGAFYDSLNSPGTSGQVLVSTSGGTDWRSLGEITGVDGVGTSGYVARWIDGDTIGTGVIYDNGTNVGISIVPSGAFHVARDKDGTTNFDNMQFIATSLSNPAKGITFGVDTTNNIGIIYGRTIGVGGLGIKINGDSLWVGAGTNASVGIGTSVPSAKLHVTSSSATTTGIIVRGAAAQTADLLQIQNSAGTTLLDIDAAGSLSGVGSGIFMQRVGIGLSNPSYPLHVNGTAYVAGNTYVTGYYYGRRFGTYGWVNGDTYVQTQDGYSTLFNVGTTEIARITSSGLGIGTTSPSQKLDINGSLITNASIYVSGNNQIAQIYNDGNLKINAVGGYTRILTNFMVDGNVYLNDGDVYGLNASTKSLRFYAYDSSTHGDIQFYSNNSVERMRVDSAGNIGIGTTSPTQKLDVRGSAFISGALYDSNNSAGTNGQVLTSTATGTDWKSLSEITGVDGVGTSGYVARWIDTDTISSGVIYDNGTNVGIGTTSPSYKLDVSNAINAGATYRIGGQTAIDISAGSSNMIFGSSSANTITTIRAGGTTSLVASGGNIGIGTTSPTANFQVIGESKLGGSSDGDFVSIINSSSKSINISQSNAGSAGHNINIKTPGWSTDYFSYINGITERFRITGAGNVGVGTSTPSEMLHINGNIRVSGAYYDSNNSAGTNGQVLTSTATGTDWKSLSEITGVDGVGVSGYVSRWIDTDTIGTGIIYDNGTNVGIGTISPAAKLNVIGEIIAGTESGTVIRSIGANNSDLTLMRVSNGTNLQNSGDYGFSIKYMGTRSGNENSLSVFSDNQVNTSQIEALTILQDGKIGVGVTNPSVKLEIGGDLNIGYANENVNRQIVIHSSNPANKLGIIQHDGSSLNILYSISNQSLNLGTSTWRWTNGVNYYGGSHSFYGPLGASPIATISAVTSGVGINTTSPTARFHVETNAATATGVIVRGAASQTADLFQVQNSAGTTLLDIDAAGSLSGVGSGIFMGRVGIGLSNPTTSLQVALPLSTTNYIFKSTSGDNLLALQTFPTSDRMQLLLGSYNGTNTPTLASIADTNTGLQLPGSDILRFVNNSIETVSIIANGNVGIGTTSPSQKLNVDGNVLVSQYSSYYIQDTLNYLHIPSGQSYLRLGGYNGIDFYGAISASDFTFTNNTLGNLAVIKANTGRVGIGISSPSTRLHIRSGTGDVSESGGLTIEGTGTGARAWQLTPTTSDTLLLAIPGLRVAAFNSAGKFFAGGLDGTSGAGARFTASTSGVTVGQNYTTAVPTPEGLLVEGRVGIGTTTPTAQLQVNAASATVTGVIVRGAASQTADFQQWQDSAGTMRASVTKDGDISFHTSSSRGLLWGTASLLFNGQNEGVQIRPYTNSYVGFSVKGQSSQSNDLTQWKNSSGSVLARVDAAGSISGVASGIFMDNVGIGTANPSSRLEVNGNIRLTTTGHTLQFTNQNVGMYRGGNYLKLGGYDGIVFESSNNIVGQQTERMRITVDGNVGIGTTNPQYLLDVSGTIRANHVTAITKSFLIEHPTKPGKNLRYASLEGPENGVYIRGITTDNEIELPEYWAELVDLRSITVDLTALKYPQPNLYVEKITSRSIKIGSDRPVMASYTVYGERKDVPKLEVEC